ncbi:MAG: aminotransferase class I/II-fold pyridoxal phosphate-dependent enzyme, partial [Bdellovibrionota bacterium]
CFGVPGLRIGWCVGPTKALAHMQNEKNYTTHTVNPITEWISFEVLKNFQSSLFKQMREEWLENKKTLQSFLSSSQNIIGSVPEGGLVTSLGFKNTRSLQQTRKLILELQLKGIFVLPLESMEFGKFEFQKQSRYLNEKLCGINKGYGFRLGLGCEVNEFKKALKEIENISR